MPKIPAELKPALGGYHHARRPCSGSAGAPWARSSSASSWRCANHYLVEAYTLDLSEGTAGWPMVPKYLAIGIGMWLGTIMWFNVWFVIWPNQQKALNIGGKYPDLAAADKAAAAKTAMIVQPHQHAAVHPHAVQHGRGGASVLI